MIVWVVEVGEYSQKYVEGVYADPETAKRKWPDAKWTFDPQENVWDGDPDLVLITAMNVIEKDTEVVG